MLSLLQYMYIFSIITIFIPINFINPIFFLTFSFLTILYSLISKKIIIKNWYTYIIMFLIYSITICFFNVLNYNNIFYGEILLKLLINLIYLICVNIFININNNFELNKNLLKIIKLIIVLTFIQIIYIYIKNNSFLNILSGNIITSSDRYGLLEGKVLFGHSNKNIWSTKVLFIQLLYLYKKGNRKFDLYIIISFINIILLSSRTAQLSYFIAFFYLILKSIIRKKNILYLQTFGLLGLMIVVIVINFLINKIMNINMNINDGGYIRLIYWKTFFEYFSKTNFIIGNGQLYASIFLPKFSPIYIGENNLHNVILNILLDFGTLGFTFFIIIFINVFKEILKYNRKLDKLFIIIIPYFITISLQYLGYDNDLIFFLGMVFFFTKEEIINLSVKKYKIL